MLSLDTEGNRSSSIFEEEREFEAEAIDITQWRADVSINSETIPIDFTCWDPRGDASSYVTRQLFFGGRSLFLLVFSLQRVHEAVEKLSYWLQLIRTKAPNSSVILVGTHSDKKPLMESSLLEYVSKKVKSHHFSNVKKILAVSNKSYKGIDTLQLAIHELAKEERSMGEKVPAKFLALEDSLHTLSTTLRPPIISWTSFKEIGKYSIRNFR
jgi:GTPase SAR1 family protein